MDSAEIRSGQFDLMGCLLQVFVFFIVVVALVILFVGIMIGVAIASGL